MRSPTTFLSLTTASLLLLLLPQVHAHFTVAYPPTVGPFDDEREGTGPCGGYTPDLSSLNDTTPFHVGGDAIATYSTHPQTDWLFRITTDAEPASSRNWTQVWGVVQQSGPGNYCTPAVTVPESYVGQKAILGIVASGLDGFLYQCSAVTFVEGTNDDVPSACFNRSGVTGTFTTDDSLTSQLDSSSTSSTTSETPNAGAAVRAPGSAAEGVAGALTTVGIMMVVGALVMV
ncbi:hypothetical protein F4809DRAFT_627368 [Biscogniauxia mediterranea]|nr:hypothetical protein F4809DRAFT_627368 [Biscogniauxia mediterranea]